MAKAVQQTVDKSTWLPTPPVGTVVQWFNKGKEDACYAAVVTRQEGAGRVEVVIFPPKNLYTVVAHYRIGVLHRTHPSSQIPHSPTNDRNGFWDYLPGQAIPEDHWDYARQETERARIRAEASERELREREEAYRKSKELTPDLPTPLPMQ